MTVEAAVRTYLDHGEIERGLSSNTMAAYRRDLARYVDFLEGRATSLGEVTTDLVEAFAADLVRGDPEAPRPPLATSSVARMMAAVRGLHRFAYREGLTGSDPAAGVTPPKPGKRLPKALPVDDVIALLTAAGGADSADPIMGRRDRALVEVLYSTGARVSEVCGLDIDDLSLETPGETSVRLVGKGSKERIVPLGGPAEEALRDYLAVARPALSARGSAGPAVFLGRRGRRLGRQGVWEVISAAASRAGINADRPGRPAAHVSPHVLRHSCATHLLEGGADVRSVQELLGHSAVTTTQIYTKVTVGVLREVWAGSHPRAR